MDDEVLSQDFKRSIGVPEEVGGMIWKFSNSDKGVVVDDDDGRDESSGIRSVYEEFGRRYCGEWV